MKVKLITGKPWSGFHSITEGLQARVEYANIECKISQLEHSLSLRMV